MPRFALAAALVALALFALWRESGRDRELDRLLAGARETGLDAAAIDLADRRAHREPDPADRRLAVASELLRSALLTREPLAEASFERLAAARELAREALARQPASHEAAMILGATLSLERSRARDTRLFSLASEWEEPLRAALALAPGAPRPRHLLAAAYLEVWPALSPAKRELARTLLREAFRDPPTFERLFHFWVTTAGSLDAAAELLPDEARTWKRLAETARTRAEWSEHARLVDRFRASLAREIEGRLAQSSAGDASLPLHSWEEILREAPRDDAFAPLVERALALRPPGAASPNEALAAESWFQWAAPLCLVNDCPLSGAALSRLASLAGGLLAPEQAAFAALAAGDVVRADLLERRTESLWSEPWAPYLTLKASRREAAGDRAGARAALASTHRAFRARAAWRALAAKTELSAASLPLGLPELERDLWEASDWWFERGASRLDLVPSRGATALALDPQGALASGALIEPLWDGRRLPLLWIPPRPAGAPPIRLPLSPPAAGSRAHLLEVRVLWGDLRPAMRVRLD